MADPETPSLIEYLSQEIRAFDDQEIFLQRPMQAFAPWVKYEPSGSILPFGRVIEAVFGIHSDTMMRNYLGNNSKNYENVRKGRHQLSSTTITSLENSLGWIKNIAPITPLQDAKGPLVPEALQLLGLSESLLTSRSNVSKYKPPHSCPKCKLEIYPSPKLWWKRTGLDLDLGSTLIIDRLLHLQVPLIRFSEEMNFITDYARSSTAKASTAISPTQAVDNLWLGLLADESNPMGHWLKLIRISYGARNFADLSEKLDLSANILSKRPEGISHGLLRKWSSGQMLIPPKAARLITEGLPEKLLLDVLYFVSRLNTFLVELIIAASKSELVGKKQAMTHAQSRLAGILKADRSFIPVPNTAT